MDVTQVGSNPTRCFILAMYFILWNIGKVLGVGVADRGGMVTDDGHMDCFDVK